MSKLITVFIFINSPSITYNEVITKIVTFCLERQVV